MYAKLAIISFSTAFFLLVFLHQWQMSNLNAMISALKVAFSPRKRHV